MPYLENEDDNFTAKITAFCFFLSIVLLIFAMQHLGTTALFLYFTSWILTALREKMSLKDSGYSTKMLIICIGIMVGYGLMF